MMKVLVYGSGVIGCYLYQPKGFFTAPYETQSSLRERLSRMYETAEVTAVEGIGCFCCRK